LRPLIGVTGSMEMKGRYEWRCMRADYFEAVRAAGGIPVMLPFLETEAEAAELLARLDGLLLAGGEDVDPHYYGEEPLPGQGEIVPERDHTELLLAKKALALDLPILAICRGEQLLAVAVGGALYQDIPTQVKGAFKHKQEAPRWYATHTVHIKPGSKLAAMLGSEVRVNSFHHQAVKTLPKGFTVTAEAEDGIIEAYESDTHRFVVAVQWHPESFVGRSDTFAPLFAAFVAEAAAEKAPLQARRRG
jgi:putative glutamine amidotransferase